VVASNLAPLLLSLLLLPQLALKLNQKPMDITVDVPPLPPYNSLKPTPASTPSIDLLTSTLGSLFRITLNHTPRLFIGTFVAIDPQGNLVLDQALEFEVDEETGAVTGDPKGREVGLIMVPRKWWKTVERMKTEEEMDEEASKGQTEGCTPS
jgi:small nuclear ribonucleoprotein (snRNP)-like protein